MTDKTRQRKLWEKWAEIRSFCQDIQRYSPPVLQLRTLENNLASNVESKKQNQNDKPANGI
jgi:hypothetical protein